MWQNTAKSCVASSVLFGRLTGVKWPENDVKHGHLVLELAKMKVPKVPSALRVVLVHMVYRQPSHGCIQHYKKH